MHTSLLVGFAALLCALPSFAVKISSLQCEGVIDPLAVQTPQPDFSWQLESDTPSQSNLSQSAYRIVVTSADTVWDSGRVVSRNTIHIPYAGRALASGQQYAWKVQVWDQAGKASAWSQAATFRMGLLHPEDWKARWIAGPPGDAGMPVFRRSIHLDKKIRQAITYIAGLGQYELVINQKKVGSAVLIPGWTNYNKTVLYNTYDVTNVLTPGDNIINVMLGNGFFDVPRIPGRYTKLVASFGRPMLIAQTHVIFVDGTTAVITTDARWQTHPGPITTSHEYGGEDYDARLESAGQAWRPAIEVAGPGGRLIAQMSPDIRVFEIFRPRKITDIRPGTRVYDLGQNFSGWPRISVRGPAGAKVMLIPAELLAPDGRISQRNSGSPMWFSYTLKGQGVETWTPRFSYYGFRYLQVESPDAEVISVAGEFLHSSAPVIGEFSCSNQLFNRIHKLIGAAILSNMQSVLTDCPHREKLGWLEESHLLGSAVMYNYGVEGLYQKIANDIHDSQTADGLVPDIAPEYTQFAGGFRDSPEWGSAAVLDPWLVYRHFGNRRNLADHYDDMKRYVAYLASKAPHGILSYGLGDWFDIGPKPPGVAQLTSLDVTATAIYYADLVTLHQVARVLGKTVDADRFAKEAGSVRTAFNAKLLDTRTGIYDRGSQTAYAMPLALGMVPAALRADALKKLADDVKAHHNHTTAGDIGFHFVIQALSEGGRSDVIYDMLSAKDPPSYAAQLAGGATTLTEAWDSDPRVSQNHFMLGHAEEWFYRYLAGIDFDLSRPADEQIVLRPTPVGDMTWAKGKLQSPLGLISISWQRDKESFTYDCQIPVNARAKLLMPASGGPQFIGSGRHHFKSRM
jgi:hypothetical protein